jgi:hypothetical protein
MAYETSTWLGFWLIIIMVMILLIQGWVNIVDHKLTKISFDALMLIYLRVLRGKKSMENSKRLLENEPKRTRTLGIYACLGALYGIYLALDWYIQYLR